MCKKEKTVTEERWVKSTGKVEYIGEWEKQQKRKRTQKTCTPHNQKLKKVMKESLNK
jgi:hypothetical protein